MGADDNLVLPGIKDCGEDDGTEAAGSSGDCDFNLR